jgi:hypothetical protein
MSGVRVSVQQPRWRISVGGVQLPLIVLKLVGVISWPWSMVLLPLWFGLGFLFIIGLGIAVAVGWQRVTQLVQDRRSGEPAALLIPNRTQD